MAVRFLSDENVYREIVDTIRAEGFDIITVGELGAAGASDEEVLELARKEERVLITFDRDFSDIRYLPQHVPGVIVLRFHRLPIEKIARRILQALQNLPEKKLVHSLIVISSTSTRRRLLSSPEEEETREAI